MSNTLRSFIQKIYKPIAAWIYTNVALKTELASNADEHLLPVDINSLTPSSTFRKNAVIGINGVLYRALRATSNMPVVPQIDNGHFVTHTVGGKVALVIADETLNQDWEVFTDASIEYWVASINALLAQKQDTISDLSTIRNNASNALKPTDIYTYNGVSYTVDDMLKDLVKLMPKTVVTKN